MFKMFNLSNSFSFFVTIYIVFNRYASPIPRVTLSEFILLFFWLAFFLFRLKKFRIEWCLIPFCVYLLGYIFVPFTGIISYIPDIVDFIGTAARLLFIYFSIAILGKNLFNLEKGIKYIHWVAIVLALYACLQIVLSKFSIYLTTYIPFLPIMGEYNTDDALLSKAGYGLVFRPCSLFTEPAHFVTYILLALAIGLFANIKEINYKYCLFLSIACMISFSSTGLVSVGFIWLLFLFQNHRLTKKQVYTYVILGVVGLFFFLLLIYYFDIWDYFERRVFNGSLMGIANSTRFYALSSAFDASDTLIGVLFGQGLSQTEFYLPGFFRVYLCLGLIGVLLTCIFLINMYIKGNTLQKNLILVFVFFNIGTEIILGPFSLLFLCYVICNLNVNKIKKC